MDQIYIKILFQLLIIFELHPNLLHTFGQNQNYQNYQNYPGAQPNNAAQSQFVPILFPNAVGNVVYPNYQGQGQQGGYANFPRAVTAAVRCLSGAGSGICAGSTLQPVNAPPVDTDRVAGGPLFKFEQEQQFQPFANPNQPIAQPFNSDLSQQVQMSNQAALDRIIDRTGVRPPTNMHYYPNSANKINLAFLLILITIFLQYIR